MKARIIAIQSGSDYQDGERRVEILFDEADKMYRRLRIPEKLLGMIGLQLDNEIIVDFTPAKILPIDAPIAQVIRHDEQVKREQ